MVCRLNNDFFVHFRGVTRFKMNRSRAIPVSRGEVPPGAPLKVWRKKRRMRARAARRREDTSVSRNNEFLELATWQQVPNRSRRARPKADSSATRMPVPRGRRRAHMSNSPRRRLHLRSPRFSASSSAHRLHAACAVALVASASSPDGAWRRGGKTAPACSRLLVRGALHTYYRRAVRKSAPRPSATRSLRASLSHLVSPLYGVCPSRPSEPRTARLAPLRATSRGSAPRAVTCDTMGRLRTLPRPACPLLPSTPRPSLPMTFGTAIWHGVRTWVSPE